MKWIRPKMNSISDMTTNELTRFKITILQETEYNLETFNIN